LIRDKDRHGWTQVYFPEYGWIDYEVTPGKLPVIRGQRSPTTGGVDPFAAGAIGSAEESPDFLQDIADLERLAREARLARAEARSEDDEAATDQFVFPWRPFAWAGGVIASIIFAVFLWWLSLRGMDAPTRAYARMNRMASLMGMRRAPTQTAVEFAAVLGNRTFAATEHADFIATEYQRRVYSGPAGVKEDDGDYSKQLDGAWRRVARALVAHRIRQLGGIGPELGEERGS
jgi:hypothetical protein